MGWGNFGWLDGTNGDGGWYHNKISGGGVVPAKVQGNLFSNGSGFINNVSVTLPAKVTSGSTVLVALGFSGSFTTAPTCDDDQGNIGLGIDVATSGGFTWASFYIPNITNASQIITCTMDGFNNFCTIIATEFSGIATTSPLDGHHINPGQAGVNTTNGITSGNITTTANGDLIWGACVNLSGASTLTKTSTFTQDQLSGADFNTEYLIQGTAGTTAATWTGTTADTFSSFVMAFKHA